MTTTRRWRRMMMPVAGVTLCAAATFGGMSFLRIAQSVGDGIAASTMVFNYGLILLSLLAVGAAGVSLLWSWARDRERDVIPGPALYLLGLFLLMLGVQALILGGYLAGLAGILLGLGVLFIEYRSDWL